MKTRILIILTLCLSCYSAKKENSSPKTNRVYEIFEVIENRMKIHYEYIEKNGIFEDPLGRIDYFFKMVKTVAPQLLTDTKSYKDDILNLLTDKTFQKNRLTNEGIVFVLYNLPIDDYVDILDSVLSLYKNEKITESVFELFVLQNEIASTSVYKNYKNIKLQNFLNKLLNDQSLILKVELQKKHFRKNILDLKNGVAWEGTSDGGLKKLCEIQPPILDEIKAEMGY